MIATEREGDVRVVTIDRPARRNALTPAGLDALETAVVGLGDATDLALSGRTVDAGEALRMGLVSRVVDDPHAVAVAIAANDPAALATIKEPLRDDADRETRERREAEAFADPFERFERRVGRDRAGWDGTRDATGAKATDNTASPETRFVRLWTNVASASSRNGERSEPFHRNS